MQGTACASQSFKRFTSRVLYVVLSAETARSSSRTFLGGALTAISQEKEVSIHNDRIATGFANVRAFVRGSAAKYEKARGR